jgi:hypothetical protein
VGLRAGLLPVEAVLCMHTLIIRFHIASRNSVLIA